MKIIRVLLIISILMWTLTGCKIIVEDKPVSGDVTAEVPDSGQEDVEEPQEELGPGDLGTPQDVEDDINMEDLEEDQEMTEEAKEEDITEEDIVIPPDELSQEEVDEEETPPEDGPQGEEGQPEPAEEPEVVTAFTTQIPETVVMNLQYNNYQMSYHYILVLSYQLNVREQPTTDSKVITQFARYEKVTLLAEVKGEYLNKYKSDRWYKVAWIDGEQEQQGYVFSALAEARGFRFDEMLQHAELLQEAVAGSQTAYIANYKNRNGLPPLFEEASIDSYGTRRYQSAPAYLEPSEEASFRYIEDGALVAVMEQKEGFYKVQPVGMEGEYWVPERYVSFANSLKELTKVVVVDRKSQNQASFELIDGKWNLVSYVLATTGAKSAYKLETSLGYFMAIQKRPKFMYLDDVTKKISGYAPYALRFNGGAYIHGVPVEYEIVDGKRVDPGEQEYLFTIGTTPRSHKCVRNYTSHAEFLYNWAEIGKTAVIVME